MRLSTATVGMLLGLTLALGACGEAGSTAADGSAGGSGAVTRTVHASGGGSAGSRSPCRLGGFVAAMAGLRDRLARGLSYDQYLGEVQAIRAVYARIAADEVPVECLFAAGGYGEGAFNLYIDAANAWGDCLASVSCQTRSIEPKLQHLWARAARRLAIAQRALRVRGRLRG